MTIKAQMLELADRSPTVRFVSGPTILLSSGNYLDLLDPTNCTFTIEDIAHGLSNVCRFAGQCEPFYSVAEHSFHVSCIVPDEHAYAGLMHDAAEAFIGDIAKPLKVLLPEYKAIEQVMEAAIFERFDVPALGPEVKHADVVMLATEQLALMKNRDDWEYTRGKTPANVTIHAWPPATAKAMFLQRYAILCATGAA